MKWKLLWLRNQDRADLGTLPIRNRYRDRHVLGFILACFRKDIQVADDFFPFHLYIKDPGPCIIVINLGKLEGDCIIAIQQWNTVIDGKNGLGDFYIKAGIRFISQAVVLDIFGNQFQGHKGLGREGGDRLILVLE